MSRYFRTLALIAVLFAPHARAQGVMVSTMPAATTPLAGSELVLCVQGGVSKKCLAADVAASTAALPGLNTNISYQSPFGGAPGPGITFTNQPTPWIISGTYTNASESAGGVLYVSKHTAYLTPSLGPGTAPAIYGLNLVEQGVWGNQQGVLGSIINNNTQNSQPLSTASAVALYGTGYCAVVGCSATWGGVMAGYDISGQADPSHSLYGLEIDNYANGTDNNQQRIGLQVTAGKFNSGGPINVVSNLVLLGSDPSAAVYGNMLNGGNSHAINGLVFNGMVFSGNPILTPGFAVTATGGVIATLASGCSGAPSGTLWKNGSVVNVCP